MPDKENINNDTQKNNEHKADDFDKEKEAANKAEKQDKPSTNTTGTTATNEVQKEQKETD